MDDAVVGAEPQERYLSATSAEVRRVALPPGRELTEYGSSGNLRMENKPET